jgi:hypothetical protein
VRLKYIAYTSLSALLLILGFSFSLIRSPKKTEPGKCIVDISHFAGSALLKLDSLIYKNELGQGFSVTKFKYYLGKITLKQSNGNEFSSKEYYLINEEEESSKRLVLENIPNGNYSAIEFIIGVDSLHNCSGAQSGALDPVNAMFWAWNSGYIFLKLEGKSPLSKSPGHIFEFHIGGYKHPDYCIRKVSLPLTKSISFENLKIQTINLKVDLLELLKTPTNIDFEKLSSVTDFHNATTFADNYKDMFSIFNRAHED